MTKSHRIAAGGIIFNNDHLLLVRYHDPEKGSYWVCPGGRLEDDENIVQAIIREVKEETGVLVEPKKVIAIEDLVSSRTKMIKVWMLCDLKDGEIQTTQEAKKEGIVEVGWFTKKELMGEVFFPTILVENDWEKLQSESWHVLCLPSIKANFEG